MHDKFCLYQLHKTDCIIILYFKAKIVVLPISLFPFKICSINNVLTIIIFPIKFFLLNNNPANMLDAFSPIIANQE